MMRRKHEMFLQKRRKLSDAKNELRTTDENSAEVANTDLLETNDDSEHHNNKPEFVDQSPEDPEASELSSNKLQFDYHIRDPEASELSSPDIISISSDEYASKTPSPSTSSSSPSVTSVPCHSSNLPSFRIAPSICVVCGHTAHCYYYGAACCNSCKTFFRRAVQSKTIKGCANGGNCRIEHGLRLCRECRFEKCLQQGMNPRAVQPSGNALKTSTESGSLTSFDISKSFELIQLRLKELAQIEAKLKFLRRSNYFPYNLGQTILGILAEPLAIEQSQHYQLYTTWPQFPSKCPFADLPSCLMQGKKLWTYLEAVLVVEFYKPQLGFQRLQRSDQYAVVKAAILNVMFFSISLDAYLRGFADRVVYPDGSTPLQYFLPEESYKDPAFPFNYSNLLKKIKQGIVPLLANAKVSEEEALILKMIIALDSGAPLLSENARECILKERLKYVKTLIKISQRCTTAREWGNRFNQLYNLVNQVIDLSGAYKLLAKRFVSPEFFKLSALFKEIFL